MKKLIAALVMGAALLAGGTVFAAEGKAPKFALPGLDGKIVNVGDMIGKKVVVLNFWASWCTSCAEEIGELKAFQASAGAAKAVFIGVNSGENERKARRFLEKEKYPYQVVIDQDKSIAGKYGVLGLPTTIVIGKDGAIKYRGSRPPKDFVF